MDVMITRQTALLDWLLPKGMKDEGLLEALALALSNQLVKRTFRIF